MIYWNHPEEDGGYPILAYGVDWHPDPPPFPIFLSPESRKVRIYGLNPGLNYRFRVRAFNRRDDGLPATERVDVGNSLVRFRSYKPFSGAIAAGRAAVLSNESELSDFEIGSDAASMFWGDWMVFEVRRYPSDGTLEVGELSAGFKMVSAVFDVKPTVHSERRRFDASKPTYVFPKPIHVCIEPDVSHSNEVSKYSIANLTDSVVYDSDPIIDGGVAKVCADIAEIRVREATSFAIVVRSDHNAVMTPQVEVDEPASSSN